MLTYRCPSCNEKMHAPADSHPVCPACLLTLRLDMESGAEFGIAELSEYERELDRLMRENRGVSE